MRLVQVQHTPWHLFELVTLLSSFPPQAKLLPRLWTISMVVSCCDAIGKVTTSFWSHRRTRPCILWRSKLRNTYCTRAKDCFRISIVIEIKDLNVSILFSWWGGRACYKEKWSPLFYRWTWQCVGRSSCTHFRVFWMPSRLMSNQTVWSKDLLPPSDYPCAWPGVQNTSAPVSLILLYFACQYINGCFSPLSYRTAPSGWVGWLERKDLDVSIFILFFSWNCLLVVFPASARGTISPRALSPEPRSDSIRDPRTRTTSHLLGSPSKCARPFSDNSSRSDLRAIRADAKPTSFSRAPSE